MFWNRKKLDLYENYGFSNCDINQQMRNHDQRIKLKKYKTIPTIFKERLFH